MSGEPDNRTGTRLVCRKCSAEFVVTRAGDGKLTCCGRPLKARA